MKRLAVIVLLANILSFFAPVSFSVMLSGDGHLMLGTLDVCHSATPALSSHGELLYLNEYPYQLLSPLPGLTAPLASPTRQTYLFGLQDELPPKV